MSWGGYVRSTADTTKALMLTREQRKIVLLKYYTESAAYAGALIDFFLSRNRVRRVAFVEFNSR